MGRRKRKDAAKTVRSDAPRTRFAEWLRQPTVWPYGMLVVLAFGAYAGALGNGFASDDTSQLLQNPAVRDYHQIPHFFFRDVWAFMREPGGQGSNYYRPLQFVIYTIIYYAVGFNASWFHLANILLHVANTLLVFRLGCLLLGKRNEAPHAAMLGGAIFAVHAVNTDTVVWIATLPELLMTLLVLTMLLLFANEEGAPQGWQITGLAALFLLAMMSKETAIAAPAILAGYGGLYLGRPWLDLWVRRWLYFSFTVVLIVYLIVRYIALGGLAPAQEQFFHLSRQQLALSASVLMAEYFAKLAVPWNVSHHHLFQPVDSVGPMVILSLAAIAVFLTTLFCTRKRAPLLSFGLLVILLPILPVMNLSGINESVFAERYLYLPSAGFAWIAAWTVEKLANKWRRAAWAGAGVVVAIFTYMTMTRVPVWKDDTRLYQATVLQEPTAASPHKYLAVLYLNAGRNKEAQEQLRECIRLAPNDQAGHNNMGVTFLREHKFTEAMEEFQKALALKPSFAPTYYNIGLAMKLSGHREEAEAAFRKSVQLQPDYAPAKDELAKMTK